MLVLIVFQVVRIFEREVSRPENFFKGKQKQMQEKMKFISDTLLRLQTENEITGQSEGVLVSNLAAIVAELDLSKDFSSYHKKKFIGYTSDFFASTLSQPPCRLIFSNIHVHISACMSMLINCPPCASSCHRYRLSNPTLRHLPTNSPSDISILIPYLQYSFCVSHHVSQL
jgi:hypothetical protein